MPPPAPPRTFQDLIFALQKYWSNQGCVVLQPYDMEMGAGTFHSATFLRAVGPEPWSAAYVQPSRRPTDGRYGDNPFRLQHYYQFQVCIKPSPDNFQELYLDSLRYLGVDPLTHDIRFVEDNWESPTLGAWGLGWEVWINGMEVSQFTYFQQVGGLDCRPVMGEITYGLERLGLYIQGKDSIFDIVWTDGPFGTVTYGDVFHQNEVEQSTYNFEKADTTALSAEFDACEAACQQLLKDKLVLPAYEQMVKASHAFNMLDARHAGYGCAPDTIGRCGGAGQRVRAMRTTPARRSDHFLSLVALMAERLPTGSRIWRSGARSRERSANQLRETAALKFFHHARFVHFDRTRADFQAPCDLPLRKSFNQQIENLAFARCQSFEARARSMLTTVSVISQIVFTNSVSQDVEQDLVVNRLLQKVERTVFHGKTGRADIAVRSQDDDRQ